jgi:hypothetical protein
LGTALPTASATLPRNIGFDSARAEIATLTINAAQDRNLHPRNQLETIGISFVLERADYSLKEPVS